jgi:Beta-ketoacyl synthase, N-terminal domain
MTRVYVESVGVFANGMESWPQAQSILRGETDYVHLEVTLPSPEWLPPAERRRTSDIIKLALCAGREALVSAGHAITDAYTVFTSSGGSGEVIHQICESLATAERDVSPTRFHNSVHNAPAGYWGIATRNEWPSTSLCAHDASFAAGVLEALAQVHAATQPVLLLAHDLRYPAPLDGVRPVQGVFSVALLLTRVKTEKSVCALDVTLSSAQEATCMGAAVLEALRTGNPAARSLPLLALMARGEAGVAAIENVNATTLVIAATPV